MNTFSLEGAIVARAHATLRTRIADAMGPMRALVDGLPAPRQQDFRIAFDKYEHQLFEELRGVAEREAMKLFIATYEEVAAIVNEAKRERVPLEKGRES